jgi:hypothetical protein
MLLYILHFLPLVHTFFINTVFTIAKKPRKQGNATSDTLDGRDRLPDNLPAAQQGSKETRSLVLLEGRKARIGTPSKKPTVKSVFLYASLQLFSLVVLSSGGVSSCRKELPTQ